MEWATNRVEKDGKTWDGGGENDSNLLALDPILRIFGTTNKSWKAGPTRLVIRDCALNAQWRDAVTERGLPFTEEKFENNIDRIQGKAGQGIRKTERVPAGAFFDMTMIYRIFDTGDKGKTDKDLFQQLLKTMRLLEYDALGGSGSRGYGRIRFDELRIDGKDYQKDFEAISPDEIIQFGRIA